MAESLSRLLAPYRSASIIGMCKNAGKTTVLNRIIRELAEDGGTLALTSIGRDGEATDLVTGTKKPGIYIPAGSLVATAADLLRLSDFTKEVVDTTPYYTPMGQVVLLRARSDGNVQLAGPSMTAQLAELNAAFFALGADKVLIDGAISRKTLCSRRVTEATVLCTGASYHRDLEVVLEDTRHVVRLLTLPEVGSAALRAAVEKMDNPRGALLAGENGVVPAAGSLDTILRGKAARGAAYLFLGGALTDNALRPVLMSNAPMKGLCLVVRDGSKLLLSADSLEKLTLRGASLRVLDSVNLVALTVNPFSAYGFSFDRRELKSRMAELVPVPVIDVEEEE